MKINRRCHNARLFLFLGLTLGAALSIWGGGYRSCGMPAKGRLMLFALPVRLIVFSTGIHNDDTSGSYIRIELFEHKCSGSTRFLKAQNDERQTSSILRR